jgi:hypothetical protein
MPRLEWPHRNGRPCVEIVLTLVPAGQPLPRKLLADTGAGSSQSIFDSLSTKTIACFVVACLALP